MKKGLNEYKVIEENYYSENVNDKTVFVGTLDDCKDRMSHKYDSNELLNQLKEEGVDIKEFMLDCLYDPEENGILLGNGEMMKGNRESFHEEFLEECFLSNHLGKYDYLLGLQNKPVLLKYSLTEND